MRTDDLIQLLARDDTPPRPLSPRLLLQSGAALALMGAVALAILGPRADLGQAMADPVTRMKWLLPLAVAIPALIAAMRLTRPQTRRAPGLMLAGLVAVGAVLWLLATILVTPSQAVWPRMRGSSALICLSAVTLISILPLAAGLRILRDGASTAPMRSGAAMGLAAGGLATLVYAMHCTEDAPLFFLTWYGLAIGMVTTAGALAGRWLLRW